MASARITAAGRKRYLEYLSILEQVIRDAAHAQPEDKEAHSLSNLSTIKA